MGRFRNNPLLGYWRRMCAEPTEAESALDPAVAKLGYAYRFQHPFWEYKYFADFAVLPLKLIIEVDGDSHDRPSQKEKDLKHALQVLDDGWVVARVSNELAVQNPGAAAAQALAYYQDWKDRKEELGTLLRVSLDRLHATHPALLSPKPKRARRPRASKPTRRRVARGSSGPVFASI